jgi:pyridoxal phosphate enzyme (YggS family)
VNTPIHERLGSVRSRIDQACLDAGRAPGSVRLLAASKTQPPELIREVLATGHTLLGENRAQSLRDKAPVLAAHDPAPEWHFIGRLQKNKVKYVVPWATLIHTIDSLALAEAIAARATHEIGLLVQVNTGDDPAKGGVRTADALGLCEQIHALPGVALRGLMTMPPLTERPEDAAPFFQALAGLAADARDRGLPVHELSMGMTADFPVAVAHGATIIRVGTAIFGARS